MADPDFDFDYYSAAQYLNAAASDKGAVNDPIHLSLCDAVYVGQENEPKQQQISTEVFNSGDVEEDEDDDEGDRYFCEPLDELLLPPADFHSSQFDSLPENTGFHTSMGEFDSRWDQSYFIDPSVLAIQEPQLFTTTQSTEPLIAKTEDAPSCSSVQESEQFAALLTPPQLTPDLEPEVELVDLDRLAGLAQPQAELGLEPAASVAPQPQAHLQIPTTPATPALRTSSQDSCDDCTTDTDYTPNSAQSSFAQSFAAPRKRVRSRRPAPNKQTRREKYVCSVLDLNGSPCGKSFGRSYDLERHLDIHNPNRRTHYCRYCPNDGKLFSRADALTRHIKNKHGREE